MKTLLASIVLFFLMVTPSMAQQILCAVGTGANQYNPNFDQPPSQMAINQAKYIKQQLLCPQGCGTISLFSNPTTPNAMIMTFGNGLSKLVYRASFMNYMVNQHGPNAAFGIMAHEIGHHIDFLQIPATFMDASWSRELRADAWAGCALARAGVSTNQMSGSLFAMSQFPTQTHPSWHNRIPAVRQGYLQCGGSPGFQW